MTTSSPDDVTRRRKSRGSPEQGLSGPRVARGIGRESCVFVPPIAGHPYEGGFAELVHTLRIGEVRGYSTNRFRWQSRIVVSELLSLANEQGLPVYVFAGTPDCVFYGADFFAKYRNAAQNGSDILIIFAEPPADEVREAWKSLVKELGGPSSAGSVDVRYLSKYNDALSHFHLVGDRAYRLEQPHPRLNPEDRKNLSDVFPERRARFSFNDVALGASIRKVANILRTHSRSIFQEKNEVKPD